MISAMVAFACALAAATVLTPLVRRFALTVGAVDRPGGRRVHARQIPRLGGVAVLFAFFAPLLLLFGLESAVARIFFATPLHTVGLVSGSLIVAGLGVMDDVRGVRARYKLAVQVVAAVVAFLCGFRIDAISLPLVGTLQMGVFAAPVTVFWIVAIINALNLIDGLDGLAAGVAFFACTTNFAVAAINSNPMVLLLSASLGGAILGFLLYNFNPASIFMGDSGSMFLGFVLAVTSLMGAAVKSSTTVAILVPIVALGLPIIDTLLAMARRLLSKRPIFAADKEHIHHRLLGLGLTQRRAVLVLYALCVLLAGAAITVSIGRSWQVGGALLLLTIVLLGIVRFAGYFEYLKLRRAQRARSFGETTERLRRLVPHVVGRLDLAPCADDVRPLLEDFAESAKLFEIELHHAPLSFAWVRERNGVLVREGQRLACAFALQSLGKGALLRFCWYADEPDVAPQSEILLQLVADACERTLSRPERARRAVSTGRLRPVR